MAQSTPLSPEQSRGSAPERPWRARRARLTFWMAIAGAGVCAAMGLTAALLDRGPAAVIFLSLCLSTGAPLLALRRGRVSLAAHVVCLIALVATMSGIYMDGGALGPGVLWLTVLLVLYSQVLNMRSFALFSLISCAAGLLLLGAQLSGLVDLVNPDPSVFPILAFVDVACGLAFVTLGIALSTRSARGAEREQQQLIEQLRVEVSARRAAEAEARAAEQARAVFLATVSHEVRTPLNVIRGLAEVMGDSDLNDRQHRMVKAIRGASDMVVRLLNDTLDLSKVEAGGLQLIEERVDLIDLVEQTGSVLRHSPAARHLRVLVRIDPAVGPAYLGDAVRLQQMLLNLGTNALKFTEAGEVELGLRIEGDHLRFSVRDTGPGLPPEVQAKLFQPFVQANAGTHRTHGGTGLGLAIVRGLAGVMNGTVGVESTLGSGSTFWFTAQLPPTTPAEHRAPALVPASQLEQDDELLQLLEPEVLPEPRRAAPPSAPADDPPSVLLVEDDPSNARVVAAALSREGARVTVASDGALAITFARNAHFDLILLDSHLPDMDGPTVARVLRALPVEGKIVALTGEVGEQARGRSLAAGMDAHLTKPISRAELGELLRTCRRPLSAAS